MYIYIIYIYIYIYICIYIYIYLYHHSVFVATNALRNMLRKRVSCHRIAVGITKSAYCFHDS